MIKQRNIQPHDFRSARSYPGTHGNPFDVILQSAPVFAKIPNIAIFAVLVLLAFLGGKFVWQHALVWLGFFLLDWLLLALLPRLGLSFGPIKPVVLMLAALRTPFALLPFWWALGIQVLGTLLVLDGFFIEPFHLEVHHETLATDKLAKGDSLRIAHIGDLHIERNTKREKRLLRELEAASPDLILFSGDVLNLSYVHDGYAQEQAREFLSALHAPLGVFGVTGSPPVDPPDVFSSMISGTPLQWLDNRQTVIKVGKSSLTLTGLTCSHHPEEDFIRLQAVGLDQPPTGALNILLYHSPDLAPLIQTYGFDMQLSGHTHGGQVCLPGYGALFAASLYGKVFEGGRYLLGRMTLYVSRGLGMEGGIAPRVRFLCRPEFILWEINGA